MMPNLNMRLLDQDHRTNVVIFDKKKRIDSIGPKKKADKSIKQR